MVGTHTIDKIMAKQSTLGKGRPYVGDGDVPTLEGGILTKANLGFGTAIISH
jgi:hypothetical protein